MRGSAVGVGLRGRRATRGGGGRLAAPQGARGPIRPFGEPLPLGRRGSPSMAGGVALRLAQGSPLPTRFRYCVLESSTLYYVVVQLHRSPPPKAFCMILFLAESYHASHVGSRPHLVLKLGVKAALVVHNPVRSRSSGRLQKHAGGSGVKRRMSPDGNGAWSLTSGRHRVLPGRQ